MPIADPPLDRLLTTLDANVEAFAVCEVARDMRLAGGASAAIEVHYVLAGTLYFERPGLPPIVCEAGSMLLVPARMPQMLSSGPDAAATVEAGKNCRVGADGLVRFDAARGRAGDLRLVCGLIHANIGGSFGLLDAIRTPVAGAVGDHVTVEAAYRAMLREIGTPELGSRALVGALMKACLVLFLRDHFACAGYGTALLGALRDPRLGRAVSAVVDRPAARHSVAALASVAGMSRSAFAREFALAFAVSPMAFVQRTRLNHAATLLSTTRLPIKTIAAMIGFSSRSHFSRAFRDSHGSDPSAFRSTALEI